MRPDYYTGKKMTARYEQVQCFTQEELERRFAAVREVMAAEQVDLLLILEGDWEGYSQWLIGSKTADLIIVPMEGPLTAVYGMHLIGKGEVYDRAICQDREIMALPVPALHPQIRNVRGFDGYEIARELKKYNGATIGFIHLETMRSDLRDYLKEVLPDAEYKDITLAIDPVKVTKSPEEMELIRNAVVLHEKVMAALPAIIRPGRTMQQVNAETRYLCHELGSGGAVCLNFAIQFGDDREGPLMHHSGMVPYPERTLRKGDRIFMLLESNGIGGHFTALGRNFCLGEPTEQILTFWELALKMQDFAAERLKPGVTVKEIFDANVEYIHSLGYETNMQNYLHSLGYVFGERPYLHDVSENIPLRENMVYLNHPHVRIDRGADTGKSFYDDLYAIDTYLVTKEGGVRQNRVPREIIVIE